MNPYIILSALVLVFGHPFYAAATEVDDVTSYYQPLADSEELLNGRVQSLITAARKFERGCDRRALTQLASTQLIGNFFYGAVESFANTSPLVERAYTPAHFSIYRGTTYQGSIVDTFVNLGPSVNVAGFRVGTDKLGHFMDMGFDLYSREIRGASVVQLLAQSRREESGWWGLYMTGVKSYGDIASNFDGYRFWKEFSEAGPRQYFECDRGRLKQVRRFKWSDYISAAWSEAINCSEYSDAPFAATVAANIGALENANAGFRYACPIAPEQCDILKKYYERWIPRRHIAQIISPLCLSSGRERKQNFEY